MRLAVSFLLATTLASCSPERRLLRLLALNPHLSRVDTVTIRDTVVVEGDTMALTQWLRDTVTIDGERQVIRLMRIPTGSPCDTAGVLVHATGIIRADTIHRIIGTPLERVAPVRIEHRAPWWTGPVVVALVVVVIAQSLRR